MSVEDEILVHGNELFLPGRPALFLDRDGVIVEDAHHLRRIEDIRLLPGIETLIGAARRHGALVAVVTNQSGIARGLFDEAVYRHIAAEIDRRLAAVASQPDVTVACPFHPDFTPGYGEGHDRWRKPGPGMLHFIAARHGIDLSRSILVGDNHSDVGAARRAGLPAALLLGKPLGDAATIPDASFAARSCAALEEAAAGVNAFFASRL